MKLGLGKWKGTITKVGLGVAVGIGLASVMAKLPVVSNWSAMGGFAGAYFAGGLPGAIGYGLASGALGSITNLFGTATATSGASF